MNEISHWLAMGGYSFYVWSAYGIAAVVLISHVIAIKRGAKQTRKKLTQWLKGQS